MNAKSLCCAAGLPLALVLCAYGLRGADDTKEKPTPNAQMQALLDALAGLGPKPIEKLKPEQARKQPSIADAVKALLKKQGKSTDPEPVAKVEDRMAKDGDAAIPMRVYTPSGTGPFPVLVYWHGGGFVLGDLNTYDSSCRALCNAAGCVVVSCEYRHAPEHPFPAPADDAFAAYKWVLKNAKVVGGDEKRVAVGGESAGGNLAAVTALRAREDGVASPVHQLLVYPVADLSTFDRPSYKTHADAKPLNKAMMEWFKGHYFKDDKDAAKPYASPLRAKDFKRLPAATVIAAAIDPLRSEGHALAVEMKKDGVDVVYKSFDGVTHEFFGTGAVVDEGKKAVALAAGRLKESFAK